LIDRATGTVLFGFWVMTLHAFSRWRVNDVWPAFLAVLLSTAVTDAAVEQRMGSQRYQPPRRTLLGEPATTASGAAGIIAASH
jgi:hypothetical protein